MARKKATIESHIENRADLGKFCLCFSIASLLSGSLFVLVSQMCPEVFMTVFVSASEKDFYCFVQRNWHLISTIYINYCFKVCCQETFPRPDSCVLKGKLLLLLLSSVSLHRRLGAFFFFYFSVIIQDFPFSSVKHFIFELIKSKPPAKIIYAY